jgi:hypothetical protein
MSATQTPVLTRLRKHSDRFREAAYQLLDVDAVVIHRPDLRRAETEREAQRLFSDLRRADAERQGQRFFPHPHDGIYAAANSEMWIPPGQVLVEDSSGGVYWKYSIRQTTDDACQEVWWFALFGPWARNADSVNRLFDQLAMDADELILKGNGQGNSPRSCWLIHLTDRDVPLLPRTQRMWLRWPKQEVMSQTPMWVPFTGVWNPQPCWWAVLLPNIFQLSHIAVEQAIAAHEATEPTHGEDFTWVRCSITPGLFTFTASQACAVELLWSDWEAGGVGLRGEYLREKADDGERPFRYLFKDNPAWGKLIVPSDDRKGVYRLALPNRSQRPISKKT